MFSFLEEIDLHITQSELSVTLLKDSDNISPLTYHSLSRVLEHVLVLGRDRSAYHSELSVTRLSLLPSVAIPTVIYAENIRNREFYMSAHVLLNY